MSRIFAEIEDTTAKGVYPLSSSTDPPLKVILLRGLQFDNNKEVGLRGCWADGTHSDDFVHPETISGMCFKHVQEFRSEA
jgi:hypothetical protein